MQQNLRKIGLWIWEKKERMVFAIMVIFLGWRVYLVVYPPPVEDPPPFSTPSATGTMAVPEPPTGTQIYDKPPPPTNVITGRNPFWYYAVDTGTSDEEGPSVQIEIIEFLETPSGWLVRLRVGTDRPRAYREGQKFQTFELRTIDPDEGYVEVYDEATTETYVKYKEDTETG